MPKGIFTQSACVLLARPISREQLEEALRAFDVRGRHDAAESWAFGGPSLTLTFRPEVNGAAVVDVVDQPWPDAMGHPQESPDIFGAWTFGQFGPFTYPGNLMRAAEQSWGWEAGRTITGRHQAFIRIRTSYVLGSDGKAKVLSPDYDPVPELMFLADAALALMQLPGALCYFNPNGEVLRDLDGVRESLDYARGAKLLPLDLWSNVRLFNVCEGWSMMDTVGNGQLDLPDVEACFAEGYDCGEVDRFLRNVTWYLYRQGEVINDADTMDGPGGVPWQARPRDEALSPPPRRVLSWRPLDKTDVPEVLRGR